ncbi:hypothetical protein RF11_08310 [Thelohanellus kitauei]|uniref:Uncharacterized protein n=1 Tax=Thelohanellus kitauei TaxID=669202 RepID=A0A0C2MQZ2_THEKT|nr:hypothetical protein RF11_08310 [Thelohanellus kitauei]
MYLRATVHRVCPVFNFTVNVDHSHFLDDRKPPVKNLSQEIENIPTIKYEFQPFVIAPRNFQTNILPDENFQTSKSEIKLPIHCRMDISDPFKGLIIIATVLRRLRIIC